MGRPLIDVTLLRPLAREILERPHGHAWSLQGFGSFIRLRLPGPGNTVLHVWNPDEQQGADDPGMHTQHTHPWPMRSCVLSGAITQYLYVEVDEGEGHGPFAETICDRIDGTRAAGALAVWLAERREVYAAGETYEQAYGEIHKSGAEPGTVTLVTTDNSPARPIRLFLEGTAWDVRPPRPATDAEVRLFTRIALDRWDEYRPVAPTTSGEQRA